MGRHRALCGYHRVWRKYLIANNFLSSQAPITEIAILTVQVVYVYYDLLVNLTWYVINKFHDGSFGASHSSLFPSVTGVPMSRTV